MNRKYNENIMQYSTEQLSDLFNAYLKTKMEEISRSKPENLYLPVLYAMQDGGKRIRPLLLLTGFSMLGKEVESALPAALAIEIFHNFTLLHDDIMDNAEMRRNRPTVYKKFDVNSAILSGDAMSFLSYNYILDNQTKETLKVVSLFTKTAIEVCEGQQLDMDFEHRNDVAEEEYLEMIRLKTAVLLACSLKAGSLIAGADGKTSALLYELGINLGMAFQLQDDLLDTFGTQETFGKKIGGDITANKKTFLVINALKSGTSEQKNELLDWLKNENADQTLKIKEVTRLFVETGSKKTTELKINEYFSKIDEIFSQIPVSGERKGPLGILVAKMLKRDH